ncbi:MAG: hypothetical protein IJH34_00135 [Romboutsia sp.]|nr:hypothetical protein [Romboutsia sp.]
MNKDYLKIILIPFIVILFLILTPIRLHIFGKEITLKCAESSDYYYENVYPEFEIEEKSSYENKFDEEVSKFYIESVSKLKKDENLSFYDIDSRVAYAILEEVNGYHNIKYITFKKPKNELYLKCSVSMDNDSSYDYENDSYSYDNFYYLKVSFDVLNEFDYSINDLITKNGEYFITFKVDNSYILKK